MNQLMGLDAHHNVGGFDADHQVIVAHLLNQSSFFQSAFYQPLCSDAAVFFDQTVDEASQAGAGAVAMTLVNFGVLLSANLGVMNLIPFPALDGGRLFFLFLEALRGKPVDQEKEAMIHTAGMALLLAFMVFILFNDVRKLF